jgi:uncharacterized membrane protein YsdA (DUF1294 family)/cold shock CspA family protein
MRYQGRLTGWKHDQGFGFVTPNGGGQNAFVHIRAFSNRQRRPVGNEIVTYEVAYDPMGRPQALEVEYFDERNQPARRAQRSQIPLCLAAAFLVFLGVAAATGKMPWQVSGFYLAASAIAYVVYSIDKTAARNGEWRIPESTLHLLALGGGWPGALGAQYSFRHKLKKTRFLRVFWCTVIANCGMLGWLMRAAAASDLRLLVGF